MLGSADYLAGASSEELVSGSSQACVEFGALDDILDPILEDVEFYKVSLTTDNNANIIPELSVADIFIIDNDGMLRHTIYMACLIRSELTVCVFAAASVSLEITTVSLPEGNAGEMTRVRVCVILDDIQGGLLRELTYTLTVNFGTAGIYKATIHVCTLLVQGL